MEEKELVSVAQILFTGFIVTLVLIISLYSIGCFYRQNKFSFSREMIIFHVLNFILIVVVDLMNILLILEFYLNITKYCVNRFTNIFLMFLLTFTIVTVIINYLFKKIINEEIKYFNDKTKILSFIIKILTALSLFITGIKGIFDNFSVLSFIITFLSFVTFLFSYLEIQIIIQNKKKQEK